MGSLCFISHDRSANEAEQSRRWSNPIDLYKFLQTYAKVYALQAFAFLQSGQRLGAFIGWILGKQKPRNKNNLFFWAGLIALAPARVQASSIDF